MNRPAGTTPGPGAHDVDEAHSAPEAHDVDEAQDLQGPADLRTRDDVERLVRAFYRDAAMDDVLGPVFESAHVDWPSHIETITDFWCWQLLGQRGYAGNPLRAHEPVHARHPFGDQHFLRWVELFVSTVDDSFRGPCAETAKHRAVKMAAALQRLLADPDGTTAEPTQPISGRARAGASGGQDVARRSRVLEETVG